MEHEYSEDEVERNIKVMVSAWRGRMERAQRMGDVTEALRCEMAMNRWSEKLKAQEVEA